MNKISFKSKKDTINFLKEKGIDASNWSEEKWQSINISQAEIHIQALAEAMYDAMYESTPKDLNEGEWHIPLEEDTQSLITSLRSGKFNDEEDITPDINKIKLKIATARCARVSYTTVGEEGKEPNYENDVKLHDRLIDSNHWSPLEHCARVMSEREYKLNKYSRNFEGFVQYRAMVEGRGY